MALLEAGAGSVGGAFLGSILFGFYGAVILSILAFSVILFLLTRRIKKEK